MGIEGLGGALNPSIKAALTMDVGGTVTGEHGVGAVRRERLVRENAEDDSGQ